MCLGAVGSQTAGSIIRPASYCGIPAMKPTLNRVSTAGVVPISRHLDHVGPFARSVGDLRILLAAMAGADLPARQLSEPPDFIVFDQFFQQIADEAVTTVTQGAYQSLLAAGARMTTIRLPESFRNLHAMHRCIMAVEAAETHFNAFNDSQDSYGEQISKLIEEGLSTFAIDYSLALRHQQVFCNDIRQLLGPAGIAIMPSTPTAAPAGLATTGDAAFNTPWSYSGVPAITIPCGLSPDGLPCGLQLVGPVDSDELLLDVAQWCEEVVGFRDTPPLDTT
jgi:aspartyl-tRNA(Asn)/glutamyl-tRNA(Gln) amidotransferase subunit A